MGGIESKIKEVEEEIRRTPYNKATQHHIGKLKAKLAQLSEELERKSGGGGKGEGFAVRKSGDATVVMVGPPSVGKSTLLNRLTGAESEVAGYDFTTLDMIPGMLEHRGAKIQLLDIPGLIRGASRGKGRGREVLAAVRSADLILLMVDVFNVEEIKVMEEELYLAGIRPNTAPPAVKITPRPKGGININSTVHLSSIDEDTIKSILHQYRLHNCDVVIREDVDEERFIDALARNRVYLPAFAILNKIDLVDSKYLREARRALSLDHIAISAREESQVEELKEKIFSTLDFVRVYMKPQGEKADMEEPLVVPRGSTIEDIAVKLHRDFKNNFRFARVWGESSSFPGQRVGLEHRVKDGDVISLVIKK